ncbi:hypothetical protein PNK_0241 [Candidatus Protochlamydia naegleriophila]|uniref:Uncharacterized protein n=2 Tax=Candidatus Protochlamydia naegleriophila TaxID=389348 RepID=A0A0U5JDN7_9BACT|nr:hypothetical protein PNK_0241 [Candidatus Protochlamydia naegleriophila]
MAFEDLIKKNDCLQIRLSPPFFRDILIENALAISTILQPTSKQATQPTHQKSSFSLYFENLSPSFHVSFPSNPPLTHAIEAQSPCPLNLLQETLEDLEGRIRDLIKENTSIFSNFDMPLDRSLIENAFLHCITKIRNLQIRLNFL